MLGDCIAVGYDQDRTAALSMPLKHGKNPLLRLGVDLAGRLVGDENGRLGSERYGETRS